MGEKPEHGLKSKLIGYPNNQFCPKNSRKPRAIKNTAPAISRGGFVPIDKGLPNGGQRPYRLQNLPNGQVIAQVPPGMRGE